MQAGALIIDSTQRKNRLSMIVLREMRLQDAAVSVLKAMRYFFVALALYIVVLGTFDAFTMDGRYRKVVWQEASLQAQRVNAELRHLLGIFGI